MTAKESCPFWEGTPAGKALGPIEHSYSIKELIGKSDDEYSILICSSCKKERVTNKKETFDIGYFYIGGS